jgi:hypothetical protein
MLKSRLEGGAMMRSRHVISVFLVAIFIAAPTTSFAIDTPSPQSSPSPTHTKQVLTQAQKNAISTARSIFAAAKLNAQNGFDRALADAQAVRDQAIAAAGTNAVEIRAAKKNYSYSYKIILRAYKSDLDRAKSALKNALTLVRAPK